MFYWKEYSERVKTILSELQEEGKTIYAQNHDETIIRVTLSDKIRKLLHSFDDCVGCAKEVESMIEATAYADYYKNELTRLEKMVNNNASAALVGRYLKNLSERYELDVESNVLPHRVEIKDHFDVVQDMQLVASCDSNNPDNLKDVPEEDKGTSNEKVAENAK